jgi:hypothetical protein
MVSTFNEWHEDTQIEPTIVAAPTAMDNASGTLAQGYSYSGYGNLYLDELRLATVPEPPTILLGISAIGSALLFGLLKKQVKRAEPTTLWPRTYPDKAALDNLAVTSAKILALGSAAPPASQST